MAGGGFPRIAFTPRHAFSWFFMIPYLYCSVVFLGMWLGFSGGALLQELELIRPWGRRLPLEIPLRIFIGGLVATGGWVYSLWVMRKSFVLTAKACWSVPAMLMAFLGTLLSVREGLLLIVFFGMCGFTSEFVGSGARYAGYPDFQLNSFMNLLSAFSVLGLVAAGVLVLSSVGIRVFQVDSDAVMVRELRRLELVKDPVGR